MRRLLFGQRPAINFDTVAARIDLCAELEHDAAVDPHTMFTNHALGGAARGQPGMREDFMEALLHGG
jgi:hypothetical protein